MKSEPITERELLRGNLARLKFEPIQDHLKITGPICNHALGLFKTPEQGYRIVCPLCEYALNPGDQVDILRAPVAERIKVKSEELFRDLELFRDIPSNSSQ